jgi:hypothetical protein
LVAALVLCFIDQAVNDRRYTAMTLALVRNLARSVGF